MKLCRCRIDLERRLGLGEAKRVRTHIRHKNRRAGYSENGKSLPSVGTLETVENTGGMGPIETIVIQYLYENSITKFTTLLISNKKELASNMVLSAQWSSLEISLQITPMSPRPPFYGSKTREVYSFEYP